MPTLKKIPAEGPFRKKIEAEVSAEYAKIFAQSPDSIEDKLHNFIKYTRRQDLTRLMARYEIFKKCLHVKGSVVECGVFKGSGLMSWALFSDMLEPINLTRRIYGFDTFEGFPTVSEKDKNFIRNPNSGDLKARNYEELMSLITIYDKNRFLNHIQKVYMVKGDVIKTIPQFIKNNKHLVVSLLFLDFDLYDSTKIVLDELYSSVSNGGYVVVDDFPFPGCRKAIFDFFSEQGIAPYIKDGGKHQRTFWQK